MTFLVNGATVGAIFGAAEDHGPEEDTLGRSTSATPGAGRFSIFERSRRSRSGAAGASASRSPHDVAASRRSRRPPVSPAR